MHDRLGPRQSGPVQHATPVRPIPDQLDRSHQRPVCISSLEQEYRIKEKKEEIQPATSLEKAKADEIVQIGDVKVVVQDTGKRLMVFGKLVDPSIQKPNMTNDHEASSSRAVDKYHQPRLCPRLDSHSEAKVAASTEEGEEETGGREVEGRACQQVHAHDSSRQSMTGQVSSLVSSKTGWTDTADRSDQCVQPVRPP